MAALRGYNEAQTKVLLAQSALETANWTADKEKSLWYEDKNLFGMSEMYNEARRRRLRGVRLGPDGLYRAQFRTLRDSVADRLDWDEQMGIPREGYLQAVAARYHGSPDYAPSVGSRIDNTINRMYWLNLLITPVLLFAILKLWKTILV